MPTLTISEAAYRQLAEQAARQHISLDDLAARLLAGTAAGPSIPLDTEYHAECGADTTPVPTLAEVRAVTAKLGGSLSAALIAERDER